MLLHVIVAARPNFMKAAPLWRAIQSRAPAWETMLVHTGQHYDPNMSDIFFEQLGLPDPHAHLGIGGGSHAEQTAGVMVAFEHLCSERRPDWVVVIGDVNATAACTLTASKLGIRVAHLEAGLRSGDRGMPEEINRVVTDSVADLLWTPSADADANLLREGVPADRIACVGNIMIDAFELQRAAIAATESGREMGLAEGAYGMVTLHRPSNVDVPDLLTRIMDVLETLASRIPLIFPLHPRTRRRLTDLGRLPAPDSGIVVTEPLGYHAFMNLVSKAGFVVTDSGGVQEETTYLNIPCLTMRPNTERPVTITHGTNMLVTVEDLAEQVERVLNGRWKSARPLPKWDGRAASRIVDSLDENWHRPRR
jgi:UDP-N-acetylglucosamine 2-epimerase (non-hydrolysing)